MAEVLLTADGGVKKIVLREGEEGIKAPAGVTVQVHYVGKFPAGAPRAGEVFDSSRAKGRVFQFPLGAGRVIKGWDIGVASMQRGELCTLTCSAPYAYGERGAGNGLIPGNATLEFEVELLGFDGEPGKGAPKCSLA